MITLVARNLTTPVGALRLVANDRALAGVYFEGHKPTPRFDGPEAGAHPILDLAERAFGAWFEGDLDAFAELPTHADGTALELAVWKGLRRIPAGETSTYGELAAAIGHPNAARPVGRANGRNPLSIVVPCHRVVGKGGALTGYAGGLERKAWLLEHERRHVGSLARPRNLPARSSVHTDP
ncbi:MAG: methylated-DNA--[protein]-cysteine S-methyltransferase [Polyangiaceae bacterium]|nr:methylated-DNA--[protein]-cysteine S-methyltransferase [Polyangiaceae bacterium]